MTKEPSIGEVEHYHDLLRLGEPERNNLLNDLDRPRSGNSKAKEDDNPEAFRDSNLKFIAYQPGGTESRWLVASRTLSSTSMEILTGSFLHEGTYTEITLRTRSGEPIVVKGRVTSCEHVRAQIHLAVLEFDKDIDLGPILSSKSA